jgi:hypothetical protein
MMNARYLLRGLVASVALLVLAQLLPYGREHNNPAVAQEPAWDSCQQARKTDPLSCTKI